MGRIFFAALLIGLLLLVGGGLYLGAFPPTPVTHPVEKIMPNDRFQTAH